MGCPARASSSVASTRSILIAINFSKWCSGRKRVSIVAPFCVGRAECGSLSGRRPVFFRSAGREDTAEFFGWPCRATGFVIQNPVEFWPRRFTDDDPRRALLCRQDPCTDSVQQCGLAIPVASHRVCGLQQDLRDLIETVPCIYQALAAIPTVWPASNLARAGDFRGPAHFGGRLECCRRKSTLHRLSAYRAVRSFRSTTVSGRHSRRREAILYRSAGQGCRGRFPRKRLLARLRRAGYRTARGCRYRFPSFPGRYRYR